MANDFVWYELLTTDLDAAAAFYRDVVGWQMEEAGAPGMRYLTLNMGDKNRGVGGMMEMPPAMHDAGMPPKWLGYIYVDDVDAATQKVSQGGGAVRRAPSDIPGVGRFSVVADPQGAVYQLFKPAPQGHVPEPLGPQDLGNVGWHELITSDRQAAWAFYEAQYGWKLSEGYEMGSSGYYQTFTTNELPMNGGIMNLPDFLRGQDFVPIWKFYVNVDDLHAAKARIEAGGGKLVHGPVQVPGGSWIMNAVDPQGASFALFSTKG